MLKAAAAALPSLVLLVCSLLKWVIGQYNIPHPNTTALTNDPAFKPGCTHDRLLTELAG